MEKLNFLHLHIAHIYYIFHIFNFFCQIGDAPVAGIAHGADLLEQHTLLGRERWALPGGAPGL